jgi:homocitrate synthase NifV
MPAYLVDTTLRDGEQAPGVSFSLPDKLRIATTLTRAGIAELEVGAPAMGEAERREMREIASLGLASRLTAWCRATEADLGHAVAARVDAIHLSLPTSAIHIKAMGKDNDWVLARLCTLVPQAREAFDYVSVGAQDASRADPAFLRAFTALAFTSGAARLRVADTTGVWDPFRTARTVGELRQVATGELGFHAHNDLGMATANALAALRAGADCVDVTVNGLGERAGNAALEQLVMAAHLNLGSACGITTGALPGLSRLVAEASGRPVASSHPIVGDLVFTHESGIHCRALAADPRAYQPFAPEDVGRRGERIVAGTHSGTHGVMRMLWDAGVPASREDAARLLPVIRQEARLQRRALTVDELAALRARVAPKSKRAPDHALSEIPPRS